MAELTLQIVALREAHLEDAAALACARYRALRQRVPCLPARYEHVDVVLGELCGLYERAPAVTTLDGPRLAGFLAAWPLPDFRGRPAAFSPEWANAAAPDDSRRIYQELYAAVAGPWVDAGYRTHLVSALTHDAEAIHGWHWLGFGSLAVDGVRGLTPVAPPVADVEIRRAGPQDVDVVLALTTALHRHLAAPPAFMPKDEPGRAAEAAWLDDPRNALWLACEGGEAVACMRQGPASHDASAIIVDEGTTSITGAYTVERARGRGVAAALLDRVLAWGREQGYVRCAVDFEPMNAPAARFWSRHFHLVSYTLMRQIERCHGEA